MTPTRRAWIQLASGAGIGRVLGLASNLLLSRWLGPTQLGLFNLVTTAVQTSDTLVRCGGDYALNYELGGLHNSTQTERGAELARGLTQLCSVTSLLICIAVTVWVWCGQALFPTSLDANERFPLSILLLLMIACEGISASAWEVLLVSYRTAELALRQGLFFPLRLLFAAVGALLGGVLGAMSGWSVIAFIQCLWLRRALGNLWNPLNLFPFRKSSISQLLRRGMPFYAANLLSSIIFYPLLLEVASSSGLAEIGYLRVGQILQQLFAFLPATLVPILFLKLRGESNFPSQILLMEKPLRTIWLLLLGVLLLYCMVDKSLIALAFGTGFLSAVLPTRLLLLTALLECLAQLVVQPFLASGKSHIYGIYQNGSAILAAALGWILIPKAGLGAYLFIRLLYVLLPLIGLSWTFANHLREPQKMFSLAFITLSLAGLLSTQLIFPHLPDWLNHTIYLSMTISVLCQSLQIKSMLQND